jgi:hypothetical protein
LPLNHDQQLRLIAHHPPQPLKILAFFSATSNTGHPDRSKPAHLLFCFAPAKQPACEVEGSLFAFQRSQNTI